MEEFLYTEKYRPHTINDCILPERLKKIFRSYVKDGNIPNLLFTGSSGVGKTTIARALCEEIGANFMFINSSDERGIDVLRTKIKGYASTVSLTGGRKVIILDESDYLTTEAQAALRGAIEQFSKNCTFILTCNFKSRLITALHSRTVTVDFTLLKEERAEMAMLLEKRIIEILTKEKIEYEKAAIQHLIGKHFPDYRRILNELQRLAVQGVVVADPNGEIASFKELMKALKGKQFTDMRKWVASNSDIDPAKIYRKIYLSIMDSLKEETIPPVVLVIAKYQYQAAFVSDQEINLCAALTEIMVEAEFK